MELLWIFWLPLLPAIIAQAIITPRDRLVSIPGGNATFTCVYATAGRYSINKIQWWVNDSLLENHNLSNAVVEFSRIGKGVGKLDFIYLPLEFNRTSVQCTAVLTSGSGSLSESNVATILLQGTLSAVGSLNISSINVTIFLSWTAPFTLDISSTSTDITYCVDVLSATSSSTLHSECGITVTAFSYDTTLHNSSGCDDYLLVVIPVNAAGDGAQSNRTYSEVITPPHLVEGRNNIIPILTPKACLTNVSNILFQKTMNAMVCSAEMIIVDHFTQESITYNHSEVDTFGVIIMFTSEKLMLNRIYDVMVIASNIKGSATSTTEISTHDVIGVHITNSGSIETDYLVNSRASGSLFTFMFISNNDNIDFSKSVFLPLDRNTSIHYTLPSQLQPGLYHISAYDIEEVGTPDEGIVYPAYSKIMNLNNTQGDFSQPISSSDIEDCNIATTQDVVSVHCIFSINSSSTGFLMIVQQNNIGRVSMLRVNQTRQSLVHEPVTVQVQENGVYHVTIFPVREETGIIDSTIGYSTQLTVSGTGVPTQPGATANFNLTTLPPVVSGPNITLIIIGMGIGLGILALIAVVLGGLILVVQCRKMKSTNMNKAQSALNKEKTPKLEEQVLNLESNAKRESVVVYEEIGDAMNSFTYTQNILYGKHTGVAESGPQSDVHDHHYDEVKLADFDVAKSADTYFIKQCSAYGVPLNCDGQ